MVSVTDSSARIGVRNPSRKPYTITGDAAPVSVMLLGVWCALLTGLLEVTWLGIKVFLLHKQIWLGPNVAWMASVTNVVIFSVPGVILVLAARWWPGRPWLRI